MADSIRIDDLAAEINRLVEDYTCVINGLHAHFRPGRSERLEVKRIFK